MPGHPRGWLGPGLTETFETPRLLAELGLGYVLDWGFSWLEGCADQRGRDLVSGFLPRGIAPDAAFEFAIPSHWYVASYLTVTIAAGGLVMLPVHLASYRERGVLRRFTAAGFPRWSFAIAQLIVGLVTITVACALLLAVAAPVYGVPPLHGAWRVMAALVLGAVAFVSIGVLLGTLLPSARSAQAVGLLIFFPSFLLGAGGPPPHVMGHMVKTIAGPLPLTQLTDAVRDPWLGIGQATGSLLVVAALAVVATASAARRAAL